MAGLGVLAWLSCLEGGKTQREICQEWGITNSSQSFARNKNEINDLFSKQMLNILLEKERTIKGKKSKVKYYYSWIPETYFKNFADTETLFSEEDKLIWTSFWNQPEVRSTLFKFSSLREYWINKEKVYDCEKNRVNGWKTPTSFSAIALTFLIYKEVLTEKKIKDVTLSDLRTLSRKGKEIVGASKYSPKDDVKKSFLDEEYRFIEWICSYSEKEFEELINLFDRPEIKKTKVYQEIRKNRKKTAEIEIKAAKGLNLAYKLLLNERFF